jgi:outer membrane lipoprotein carrier protein
MTAQERCLPLQRNRWCALLVLLATVLAGRKIPSAVAQDPQPPLLRTLEAKYRKASSLRANFLERYFENGSLVRAESGVAYFRKPGKMRWEYEKPEKNLFLVDGKNAWFYTPVDHTATRIPARQSDDWRTPLALLAGEGKLSRVCDRILPARIPSLPEAKLSAGDGTGFECIVKNSAVDPHAEAPPRVFLEISDQGELNRVVVQASGSVQTEFRFKEWEVNPPLADAMFRFSPPPGVVIVNGLLPSLPSARQ